MTRSQASPGPLPTDDELAIIASRIKLGVDARVHPVRKLRRTRRRVLTGFLAAALFGGGAAAGAAITSGSEPTSSERIGTSEIQLDTAPASAKYIRVSLRVSCVPGDRYDYEIDRSRNPASTICEKTHDHGAYSSSDYEFEIDGKPTTHTVNITTKSKVPYTVIAQYASTSIFPPIEDLEMPDGRRAFELTPSWPTNQFGLTVGEPTIADARAGNLPDLTPMLTDDGEKGFVIANQFFLPEPKNPKEAVSQMKRRSKRLTVFAADGRTPVGVSTVR